jgi:hypothetical protein
MTRAVWIATNIHGRCQENVRRFSGVSGLSKNIAASGCVFFATQQRPGLPGIFSPRGQYGALARGEVEQNYSDAARQDVGF